tara:strand:- start:907 stop:1404 length:498 start_codon:yes stop_codon:yes gene_type:complete
MQKLMLSIIILASPILFSGGTEVLVVQDSIELSVKSITPIAKPHVLNESDLIKAIIQVESRGNDSAIGDRHLVGNEAVGALQLRPVMVREVNRILKIQKSDKRFKRKDRYSREKSIEMFMIWKNFHHSDGNFEKIARNWNGGPNGFMKSRTVKYWVKVQKELNPE